MKKVTDIGKHRAKVEREVEKVITSVPRAVKKSIVAKYVGELSEEQRRTYFATKANKRR